MCLKAHSAGNLRGMRAHMDPTQWDLGEGRWGNKDKNKKINHCAPPSLLLEAEQVLKSFSNFRTKFSQFQTRLSDLLRKTAELALTDMIQLLFTRYDTTHKHDTTSLY